MTRRAHGTGSVYRRKGSAHWQMQFHVGSQVVRESTGQTNKRLAESKLADRLTAVRSGKYFGPASERLTVGELAADVFTDKAVNADRDTANPRIRWDKHLAPMFGAMKAADVTRPVIDRYVTTRKAQGAANGTLNRELAFLKHCFRLGLAHEKLWRVPTFPHLQEANPREGFLTDAGYRRLAVACARESLWLRTFLEIAVTFGWRKRSILKMRVQDVDLIAGRIRQPGSITKSGAPNECKLTPVLRELLGACIGEKDPDEYLLTRTADGRRPIVDLRIDWARACCAAGLGKMTGKTYQGLLVHDLCRSASRRMRDAGIPATVRMRIMGRSTDSIDRRYDIIDGKDMDDAIDLLAAHAQRRSEETINAQFDAQSPVRPS